MFVAVDLGVAADEVFVLFAMLENETEAVAKTNGYDGIITINSHPASLVRYTIIYLMKTTHPPKQN